MVTIRQVQPDDMFAAIKIAYTVLPERYNPTIFNYFYETFPAGFLIAEHYHKIIGFIAGTKTSKHTAKIHMLAVTEKHRRHHIGTTLTNQFLTILKNHQINQVELEVKTTNTTAITFYQKLDFKITDHLHHFYQDGDDAYIMKKTL
jgi:ribosomal-protein-alanine N-acetyltransferase